MKRYKFEIEIIMKGIDIEDDENADLLRHYLINSLIESNFPFTEDKIENNVISNGYNGKYKYLLTIDKENIQDDQFWEYISQNGNECKEIRLALEEAFNHRNFKLKVSSI